VGDEGLDHIILWYATLVLLFCYIANPLVLVTVANPVYLHPFVFPLQNFYLQWDQLLSGCAR